MPSASKITDEICSGAVVVRGDKFLLLQRKKGHWDNPKGHLEHGESLIETCKREIFEEAGIPQEDMEIIPGFSQTLQYDVRARPGNRKVIKMFICRIPINVDVNPALIRGPVMPYRWVDAHDAHLQLPRGHYGAGLLRSAYHFLNHNGQVKPGQTNLAASSLALHSVGGGGSGNNHHPNGTSNTLLTSSRSDLTSSRASHVN